MRGLISEGSRCLLAAAAPKEVDQALRAFGADRARAQDRPGTVIDLDDRFSLVITGVGKASAAAAVSAALCHGPFASVLGVGIAGTLPAPQAPELLGVIAARRSVYADEGVRTPNGFIPMSDIGFGMFSDGTQVGIDHDGALTELLTPLCEISGTIATVSSCSGTDYDARAIVERTGAVAEAMEGAACAHAAMMHDASIHTGELRVVSNTTGDRERQIWMLDEALEKLGDVLGRFRASL